MRVSDISNKVKENILKSKELISKIDIEISKIDFFHRINNDIIKSKKENSAPFIYSVVGRDGLPGIFIPSNESGIFSGRIDIDSDSYFIATDIMAVQKMIWTNQNAFAGDPSAGSYFIPCVKTEQEFRTQSVNGTVFCNDFGFRITDTGNGRRLFQSINEENEESFIPSKILKTTMNMSTLNGPNYPQKLTAEHIFAKNTSINIDINYYAPFEDDVRIYISFLGRKVFN